VRSSAGALFSRGWGRICPQGAQGTRGYSVLGNTLRVFEASSGVVEETVLTQQ